MSIISRAWRRLETYVITYWAKAKWKTLSVEGLFQKRRDTQIIISDRGKMEIGKNVSFQRNVSLSSIGGTLHIGNHVAFNRN